MLRRALVFGRERCWKEKMEDICKTYEIVGFLDNAVQEQSIDPRYGLTVYPPEEVCLFQNVNIVCAADACIDMWKQLRELGVSGRNIDFGVNYKNHTSALEKAGFCNGERLIAEDSGVIYQDVEGDGHEIDSMEQLKKTIRNFYAERNPVIRHVSSLSIEPVDRCFGRGRGTPVDRYYIESFLEQNTKYIHGTVMEIGTDQYIKKYGKNVDNKIILHVNGSAADSIKGNLETGEGIHENMADCLICTQTLQYIFDLKKVYENIRMLLRPEGVALFTLPGIKSLCYPDAYEYGEMWSFTKDSVDRLCAGVSNEYEVKTYGNVKTAAAYLYGLCYEDLREEDFSFNDPQYPFIITAKMHNSK